MKLSLNGRYEWSVDNFRPYGQFSLSYRDSAASDLRTAIRENGTLNIIDPAALQGRVPSATVLNLAVGTMWNDLMAELFITNVTDERAQLTRYEECGFCTQRPYAVVETPRTIGVRFGSKF